MLMIMINNHNIHDGLARMNGFPTSCIQHYATTNNMSVSDVYKTCMLKSTEIALTNQITKCVFRNTPEFNVKSFLFLFMVIKGLLGHADLLGMRAITHLLTNRIFS